MTRDAMITGLGVRDGRRRLEVMLLLVVNDDRRITVLVVDAMGDRAERGDAQRKQQHACGHAQQPHRESQQVAHADSVSGAGR